jgi:hypothetical protein
VHLCQLRIRKPKFWVRKVRQRRGPSIDRLPKLFDNLALIVGVLLVLYAIYSLARPAFKPMKHVRSSPSECGVLAS